MKKLPISEVAQILGISKEAVYNRIRRGTLNSVEKDGQKFVILDDETDSKKSKKSQTTTKSTTNQDKFINFLLSELADLKSINANLQSDKERLFKEKEQMLLENKAEIMAVYKDRDEKLMQFLNAMQKSSLEHKKEIAEHIIDAEIDDLSHTKFISLSEFLTSLNLDKKELKKIQKKIIKRINKSKFIKFKDGIILIKKNKNLKEILGDIWDILKK